MSNQKLENLLNLALAASPSELERSPALSTGYSPRERSWELIIKYSGSLDELRQMEVTVNELLGGYAILSVPENLIPQVSALDQIEYIEKPKRLYFGLTQAKSASCLTPLQGQQLHLTGRGVLVAVIDSGIDYFHEDFRNEDGTTRILRLWDQSLDQIFTQEQINQALTAENRAHAHALVPSVDISGHGTAVAGIAAGNGTASGGRYSGIAYESELLVVKLGPAPQDGFPRTTQLMEALDYVVKEAVRLNRPIAVNLSFGNTYGAHDGTSLLETFINNLAGVGRTVIVTGTGNEGNAGGHVSGQLVMGQPEEILLSVGPYEPGLSVQLWKSFADEFLISIQAPSGELLGPFSKAVGAQRFAFGETQILVYYGEPSPYSQAQEIYMDFMPRENYLNSGIYRIILTPQKILMGNYNLWLPAHGVLGNSTRFLASQPETTLTIPSTAAKVISVGAYDSAYQSYADFSGRGYTRMTNQIKPDISAPGVNIMAPLANGGYDRVTGTSFAAPFVTGTAALLMEWGIIDGHDPYLYGEKIKARLIRGARQLPGFSAWPNPTLGYGVLCARDSLP